MSVETSLQRIYDRQEAMIQVMHGLTDHIEEVRDLVGQLTEWLQAAPPSELPDLLRAINANILDQTNRVMGMQGQLRKLPAEVARAVVAECSLSQK